MSAAYLLAPHRGRHLGEDHPDRQAQETVDAADVLRVPLGQVVIDRDQMHAVPGDRVQVGGEHRGERLALTGLHLRDVAQMQRCATHELHGEVSLTDRAHRGLAGHGERLRQQLVQALTVGVPGAELLCLRTQLRIGELLDLRLERVDVRGDLSQPLHHLRLAGAEQAGEQRHGRPHLPVGSGLTCSTGRRAPAPCPTRVAKPQRGPVATPTGPCLGQCDRRYHPVVVTLAPVDDRRCASLTVGEQVEVVSNELHARQRVVDAHRVRSVHLAADDAGRGRCSSDSASSSGEIPPRHRPSRSSDRGSRARHPAHRADRAPRRRRRPARPAVVSDRHRPADQHGRAARSDAAPVVGAPHRASSSPIAASSAE